MEVVSFFYFTKTSERKRAVTTRYKKSIQDSARYIWDLAFAQKMVKH